MPTQSEVDLHRRQTEYFIEYAPVDLVLRRRTYADDGAGGKVFVSEAALNAQHVRVVGQTRPPTRITPDGRQVTVDRSVVGMPELDAQLGDTFDWMGTEYEVINLQEEPHLWKKTAEAVRRG